MSEHLKQLLVDLDGMEFARPFLLLLLIIPISIAFWEWIRKGHSLVMPFDLGKQRKGRFLGGIVNFSQMIPQFLMVVAIVILAGPQKASVSGDEKIMNNVIFCLDISGSMRSSGGVGNSQSTRYELAIESMKEFTTMEGRKGDSFGLAVFGVEVIHWVPVTQDLDAINSVSELITPNTFPIWFEGTMIGRALRSTSDRLQMEEGDRMIILLSDGMSADLQGEELTDTIQELKDANISVYMVLFQHGPPNKDAVRIARETGGAAFHCNDDQSVHEIFARIDEMKQARFTSKDKVPIDFFEPAVYLGLCFLACQICFQFVLRYTPW